MPTLFEVIAILFSAGAAVIAGAAARVATASVPTQLSKKVRDLAERVHNSEQEARQHRVQTLDALDENYGKLVAAREQMEIVLESVEGTLERVSKTRASNTSAASRAERAAKRREEQEAAEVESPNGGRPADPTDRAAWLSWARSQGIEISH